MNGQNNSTVKQAQIRALESRIDQMDRRLNELVKQVQTIEKPIHRLFGVRKKNASKDRRELVRQQVLEKIKIKLHKQVRS